MAATTKNVAAVLHGPMDLRIENIVLPEPGYNEVLLAMGSVGICGSDIKYWSYGKCGRFTVTQPMVVGHEASGTVVKIGEGVTHLKEGDRVAIEPGVPCRTCELCKKGRYNICKEVKFCATPPIHGSIAMHYSHAADFCYRLPEHVSLDEGAMLEPLAVAVYGCERGNVGVGSRVLICGAGPVGLLCLMVAKTLGVESVCMTDIDDYRLATARLMGADCAINVMSKTAEEIALMVERVLKSKPDVTLECSGSDQSVIVGMHVTKSGGSIVLIGRGSMEVKLPIVASAVREVDIKGVFRYANCYPKALALVASRAVDVKPLITHHFPMVETVNAFETAKSREEKAIKVMIHCDQQDGL